MKVKAVMPCIRPGTSNFKMAPYEAWISIGGDVAKPHYPRRRFYGLVYRVDFPILYQRKREARLRFVEACSIGFDTFPDYISYEVIPVIWDCWPRCYNNVERWLINHRVRSAVFTSSQTAGYMRDRLPQINILAITEGIDIKKYHAGLSLSDRVVNAYEIGSLERSWFRKRFPEEYSILFTKPKEWPMWGQENYSHLLQNSKISIIFPKSDCEPEITQGIETLTQRYWECMLSRVLMVGHAPKELVDLIGFNPVIELNRENAVEHVNQILVDVNRGRYQEIADKNRQVALEVAPWEIRMSQIREWLNSLGYDV